MHIHWLFKRFTIVSIAILIQLPFSLELVRQTQLAHAGEEETVTTVEPEAHQAIYGERGTIRHEEESQAFYLNTGTDEYKVIGKTSIIEERLESAATGTLVKVWGEFDTESNRYVVTDVLSMKGSIAPELPPQRVMLQYGKTTLIILFAVLVASILSWVVRLPLKGKERDGWLARLAFLMPLAVWFLSLFVLFIALNINLSSIGEVLIAGGLAIGLILTPAGSNVVAGILNAWNDVFRVGEVIGANGDVGRVTKRGLLSTQVETPDGSFYDFPNRRLLEDVVQNFTRVKGFRIDVVIPIDDFDFDYQKTKQTLESVIDQGKWRADGNKGFVLADEIASDSFNYRVFGWIRSRGDMVPKRGELLEECILALEEEGIRYGQTSFIASHGLVIKNKRSEKGLTDLQAQAEEGDHRIIPMTRQSSFIPPLAQEIGVGTS